MAERRTFSPEMKREICRQLVSGEKRLAQICREYALAESVVIRWRKAYQQRGEQAFMTGTGNTVTAEARIAELERFCGQLALENQVLKKRCKLRAHGAVRHDAGGAILPFADVRSPSLHPIRHQPQLVV